MRSRHIRTIRAAVALASAAGVLGAMVATSGATAAEPRESTPRLAVTAADLDEAAAASPAMVAAMRRDLGITAD